MLIKLQFNYLYSCLSLSAWEFDSHPGESTSLADLLRCQFGGWWSSWTRWSHDHWRYPNRPDHTENPTPAVGAVGSVGLSHRLISILPWMILDDEFFDGRSSIGKAGWVNVAMYTHAWIHTSTTKKKLCLDCPVLLGIQDWPRISAAVARRLAQGWMPLPCSTSFVPRSPLPGPGPYNFEIDGSWRRTFGDMLQGWVGFFTTRNLLISSTSPETMA